MDAKPQSRSADHQAFIEVIGTKTLILSAVSVVGIEMILRMILPAHGHRAMGALGLARMAEILLLMAVIGRGEGLSAMGISLSGLFAGGKRGILWAGGVGCVVFAGIGVFRLMGFNLLPMIHVNTPSGIGNILLLFCVGGLVGPVAEELFFRGIVYGFLRRWGAPVALIGATFAFLLAHPCVFQKIPVIQGVGGLLFAMSYELEKNLMVPMMIHMLGNIAIFGLSLWGLLPL